MLLSKMCWGSWCQLEFFVPRRLGLDWFRGEYGGGGKAGYCLFFKHGALQTRRACKVEMRHREHPNFRKCLAQRAQQRVAAIVILVAALVREDSLNPELQAEDPAVIPAALDVQIYNPAFPSFLVSKIRGLDWEARLRILSRCPSSCLRGREGVEGDKQAELRRCIAPLRVSGLCTAPIHCIPDQWFPDFSISGPLYAPKKSRGTPKELLFIQDISIAIYCIWI